MKKTILIAVILLIISNMSFGQAAGLQGGFAMQFTKPDGLNYVVDRYNETRSFLTEEMEHFNNLDGFNYGIFYAGEGLWLDMMYTHRSQTRSAVGFDATNQNIERQLRAVIHSFGMGLGYGVTEDQFAFIFGSRLNVGLLKIRTKVGAVDEIRQEDWEDIYDQLHFDLDIHIKIGLPYIIIEPYYSFQLFPSINNMAEVNEVLNPNTLQNDPEEIPFKSNGFGLRFLLYIGG